MLKKLLPYVIIVLLLGLLVYKWRKPTIVERVTVTEKVDTVIRTHVVTDTMWLADVKYVDRFMVDTVYIDSPNIDEEVKDTASIYHYSDSTIDIDLQAKRLDWLKYEINMVDTVHVYRTIDRNFYETRKPRFYYGIGVGAGYGMIHNKFDVFIGVSAGYQF